MIIARTLAFVAMANRLVIRDDDGKKKTYNLKAWGLFCNPKLTSLYILPLATAKHVSLDSRYSRAAKAFATFHGSPATKGIRLTIPDSATELHKIGYAVSIRYRSDKWTGKSTLYHHDFESPEVRVYANRGRLQAIGIMATAGQKMVDERGIIA